MDSLLEVDSNFEGNLTSQNVQLVQITTYGWIEIVFILICIFGIIGNLVTLYVIIVLKEYQKSLTHWYVLQLALSDSIFLLTLPFKISESVHRAWIYPEWMCKGKETILFFNFYASIFFLVLMSLDRYIAVCHPYSKGLQRLRKKKVAYSITVLIWVISLSLCIPVMLFSFKVGLLPRCTCSYVFPSAKHNIDICGSSNLTGSALEDCLTYFGGNNKFQNTDLKYCKKNLLDNPSEDTFVRTLIDELAFEEYNNNNDNKEDGNKDYEKWGVENGEYAESWGYESDEYGSGSLMNSGSGSGEYEGYESYANNGTYDEYGGASYVNFQNLNAGLSEKFVDKVDEKDEIGVNDNIHSICNYWGKPPGWKAFLIFNFSVLFLFPLMVMLICYGLILHRISVQARISGHYSSTSSSANMTRKSGRATTKKKNNNSKSARERLRITTMSAALVSSFVICWLPFHSVHLAKLQGITVAFERSYICFILPTVASIFAYLSAAINPYLYSCLGTKFLPRCKKAVKVSTKQGSTSSIVTINKNKKARSLSSSAKDNKISDGYSETHPPVFNSKTYQNERQQLYTPTAPTPNTIGDEKTLFTFD